MTDAELVALLLAEARLRGPATAASHLADSEDRSLTDDERVVYDSWVEFRDALRGAVRERLSAEDERPARPKLRAGNLTVGAATHDLADCPCPTCTQMRDGAK